MQGISSPSVPPSVAPGKAQGKTRAPKKKRFRHTVWWYLKWLFTTFTLVVFFVTGVIVSIGYGLYQRMGEIVPDARVISNRNKAEMTRVLASDGAVLAEFQAEKREWLPLKELTVERKWKEQTYERPARIIDATLAIEDARFYSHPGMDPKRILKAAWVNLNSGGVEQGGSTITEQLAKNVYLSRERTYSRRLNTALLALQLEKRFSKDEILELYLNEIYYGNNVYGCEAAAQRYFGRHARELNIAQAAMLAGLPQAPTRHDPFDNFDNARERQRLVLRAMLRNEDITYSEYLKAARDNGIKDQIEKNKKLYYEEKSEVKKWRAPYFVAYVKQYLKEKYKWSDEFLAKSGLTIYTTIDPKMQGIANTIMDENLSSRGGRELQGSLVCIDPWTGRVLAMYGGRDYYAGKRGQWNRATQARRPPGSTFKPYVYATAMEMGFSPNSRVRDSRLVLKEYGNHEVKNYDFIHRGTITFKEALGMSNNVAATRILMRVGFDNVIQKSHLMGIESTLRPLPSMALGANEVNVLEHTSAFGTFATRGLHADPTPIERVLSASGEVLVERENPVRAARVLSESAANKMWDMLRYVMTNGTGRPAQIPSVESIGKTGTAQETKDVWFMGATKELVTGVWMGYDTPRRMYGASGGRWCGPAWSQFMRRALEIQKNRDPVKRLVEDARVTALRRQAAQQNKKLITVTLCTQSGLVATALCPDTHREQYSPGDNVPTQACNIHTPRPRERQLGDEAPTTESDLGEEIDPEADFGSDPARRDFNEDPTNGDPTSEPDGAAFDESESGQRGARLPDDDVNRVGSSRSRPAGNRVASRRVGDRWVTG